MSYLKLPVRVLLGALLLCGQPAPASATTNFVTLTYASAPVNNPLKGFIPYQGSGSGAFPYSMEWNYVALRSLMTGPTNFNWNALESLLNDVKGRGHQTVFRIYLDYPGLTTGIPQFLLDGGLTWHTYTDNGNTSCGSDTAANLSSCPGSVSPDYSNPNLQQALTNFIAALGARYDGDPRIAYITVGLLGFWGEWHTYPDTSWFASTSVQQEVLTAYQAAFTKTKLLVRYPNGTTDAYAIGFHDDSFAEDTLTGSDFVGDLGSKWQTQPIGGEVYPPIQQCVWPGDSGCSGVEDFNTCVNATHVTWLLFNYAFSHGFSGSDLTAATAAAHLMGYELYVTNATLADAQLSGPLNASVLIGNTAVAPFYYNWPVQLRVLNSSQQTVQTWTTPWQLSSLQPGPWQTWNYTQTNHGLALGQYKLLVGVPNPLANGPLFRFANQSQDADVQGWLTLGTFSVVTNSSSTNTTTTNNPPPMTNSVNLKVDPTQNWQGGLNYYSTGGGYLGFEAYTLAQDPAVFIPTQAGATRLLLGINTNTYALNSSWDDANGNPLRDLETDSYVDPGTIYGGDTFTFSGTVESNSLPAGWTAYAVIKEYNGGNFLSPVTSPLPASGAFTVSRNVATNDGIQYGFYVYGPNTAPGSANSRQAVSLVIGNPPANPVTIAALRTNSIIRLSFPTQSGTNYTVQWKIHLSDAAWQTLTNLTGDGGLDTATDPVGGQGGTRFYRVSSH